MRANKERTGCFMLFTCILLLTLFMPAMSVCVAGDHRGDGKHFDRHGDRQGSGMAGDLTRLGHDKGNEVTGQIVAWSLAAANLTVILSLIVKGVKRFSSPRREVSDSLSRFNGAQKKVLMKFHYVLNPLILILAILHWMLSRCGSTALPEWGLLIMGIIVVLGIILKYKLCPKGLIRNVYRLHTQPVLLLILISMLVIGHLSID